MLKPVWQFAGLVAALSAAALLASCGGVGAAPINAVPLAAVSVNVTPAAMSVATGTVQPFVAIVNGSGLQDVQWRVNGVPGGAPIIGTIDNDGNYTAPQFIPNPPAVTLTAVANADNTKSGNATVTITGAQFPAKVYMSPAGKAYVKTGTTMKLSGGVIGPFTTRVVWPVNGVPHGNATVGTITPGANNTAVYAAPATVPNPSTVTIKAIAHSDATKFTSCTATLSAQPPHTRSSPPAV
jgi:hypothetical protein